MKISRRQLLEGMTTLGASAAFAQLAQPALVFAGDDDSSGPLRFVLFVQQDGGSDGLGMFNLLGSTQQALLDQLRPNYAHSLRAGNLAIPGTSEIGAVAEWAPLLNRLGPGQLRVFPQVGFQDGMDGSHDLAKRAVSYGTSAWNGLDGRGLIARCIDQYIDTLARGSVFGLGVDLRADFRSNAPVPILARRLASFSWGSQFPAEESAHAREILGSILHAQAQRGLPQIQQQVIMQRTSIDESIGLVEAIDQSFTPPAGNPYPATEFGGLMRDVAAIVKHALDSGSPRRLICYVRQPGLYDTHVGQAAALPPLINDLAQGLGRLIQDLQAWGVWERSLIYPTVTEFGRKSFINLIDEPFAAGTDHGAGNMHLVVSGALNDDFSPVYGTIPTQSDLLSPSGNLPVRLDVRNIWWQAFRFLGFDPTPIFPSLTWAREAGLNQHFQVA